MELDGTVLGKFGEPGHAFKEFSSVHQMDCRNPDEVYVAEITAWRAQKLIGSRPRSRGQFLVSVTETMLAGSDQARHVEASPWVSSRPSEHGGRTRPPRAAREILPR